MKHKSFHSIDNNAPLNQVNCLIVTDGPNIYEKKRQRFERIQRMRAGGEMSNGPSSSSNPPASGGGGATLNYDNNDTLSPISNPVRGAGKADSKNHVFTGEIGGIPYTSENLPVHGRPHAQADLPRKKSETLLSR
jgi:hypothetical protein